MLCCAPCQTLVSGGRAGAGPGGTRPRRQAPRRPRRQAPRELQAEEEPASSHLSRFGAACLSHIGVAPLSYLGPVPLSCLEEVPLRPQAAAHAAELDEVQAAAEAQLSAVEREAQGEVHRSLERAARCALRCGVVGLWGWVVVAAVVRACASSRAGRRGRVGLQRARRAGGGRGVHVCARSERHAQQPASGASAAAGSGAC